MPGTTPPFDTTPSPATDWLGKWSGRVMLVSLGVFGGVLATLDDPKKGTSGPKTPILVGSLAVAAVSGVVSLTAWAMGQSDRVDALQAQLPAAPHSTAPPATEGT